MFFTDSTSTVLALALLYHNMGFNVVPLMAYRDPSSGKIKKRPSRHLKKNSVKPWSTTRQSRDNVIQLFSQCPDATMVGLILGEICPLKNCLLWVLDFDSHSLFASMKSLFSFIPQTWLVQTTRGFHVYLFLPRSLTGLLFFRSRQIDSLDIKRSGYVVAPDSSDPTFGLSYTFVQGPLTDCPIALPAVLDSLTLLSPISEPSGLYRASIPWCQMAPQKSGIRYASHKNSNRRPWGVSSRIWDLLHHCHDASDYGSRSQAEQAVITSLTRQGYSFDAVQILFDDFAHADSKYKTHTDAFAYLKHSYEKAVSFLATTSNPDVIHYLKALLTYRWRHPRHAPTDRRVLLTLLYAAQRFNKFPTFSMSIRELARESKLSRSAVQRSLIRLSTLGLVSCASTRSRSLRHADTITLITPVSASLPATDLPTEIDNVLVLRPPAESSFDSASVSLLDISDLHNAIWSHLGERARLLYRVLTSHSSASRPALGGLSVAELVTISGLPRSTVFYLRKRMLALGLIFACDGRLYPHPLPQPDDVYDHETSPTAASSNGVSPSDTLSLSGEDTVVRDEASHARAGALPLREIQTPSDQFVGRVRTHVRPVAGPVAIHPLKAPDPVSNPSCDARPVAGSPVPLCVHEWDLRDNLILALDQDGFTPDEMKALTVEDIDGSQTALKSMCAPYLDLRRHWILPYRLRSRDGSNPLLLTLPDKWGDRRALTRLGLVRRMSRLQKRPRSITPLYVSPPLCRDHALFNSLIA